MLHLQPPLDKPIWQRSGATRAADPAGATRPAEQSINSSQQSVYPPGSWSSNAGVNRAGPECLRVPQVSMGSLES